MSNHYAGFPLSYEKRKLLFGGDPPLCSLPVVDQSASLYSTKNRKPILTQHSRGFDWNRCPWKTTYHHEFRQHQLASGQRHEFKECPADEYNANPNSIKSLPFWSYTRDFLKAEPGNRIRKSHRTSYIPGLDTNTCINLIPWQNQKEITGVDPREVIPKKRDIRHIMKYRAAYLDEELLDNRRGSYKLQPPDKLPPVTREMVDNLMVSKQPFYPNCTKVQSHCSYLI